jgi:hypothetical protein
MQVSGGVRRKAQGSGHKAKSTISHLTSHIYNFAIVLRTPTLRAGSQFRNPKFEIISLCSLPYAFKLFAELVEIAEMMFNIERKRLDAKSRYWILDTRWSIIQHEKRNQHQVTPPFLIQYQRSST